MGHDKADLIHVGGDHQLLRGTRPLLPLALGSRLAGDQVAQGVDGQVIGQGFKLAPGDLAQSTLLPGLPGCRVGVSVLLMPCEKRDKLRRTRDGRYGVGVYIEKKRNRRWLSLRSGLNQGASCAA